MGPHDDKQKTRERTSIVLAKAALLFIASNVAVLFVIGYGAFLWPERLPGGAQHIFWLASGVNTALLLMFGLRYWPVILLDALPAFWIAGQSVESSVLGAAGNALEALIAGWLILRIGRFNGAFDRLRSIGVLILASVIAPLANTLTIPLVLNLRGELPGEEFWRAIPNWNLSNGAALLVLTPLLTALASKEWEIGVRQKEASILFLVAAVTLLASFGSVFLGFGLNAAFGAFPVVIYAAIRFGYAETAVILGTLLAAIYTTLAIHSHVMAPGQTATVIWFIQAFTWVISATGLLVAALSTERRRADVRSLEAAIGEERARLAALRYQINPHFLFNTLNSIRAATPLSETVPRGMITDLADYLRSTLVQDETDRVPLTKEFESVKTYLAIEQRRFGERLQVHTSLPPDIAQHPVPVFLLQPLVENAIRHGLEKHKGICYLSIKAEIKERLQIVVANSGSWQSEGNSTGIGLQNIRRRLEIAYPSAAGLEIEHEANQVRVILNLPL